MIRLNPRGARASLAFASHSGLFAVLRVEISAAQRVLVLGLDQDISGQLERSQMTSVNLFGMTYPETLHVNSSIFECSNRESSRSGF